MRLTLSLKYLYLFVLVLAVCCPPAMAVNSIAPVVNTTILVKKTGSEPFDDTTWDGSDLNKAGLDTDENNNVVRLQDVITYQVEVSVNDSDVDSLTTTVVADQRQAWLRIPDGCETDAEVVNPVSSISEDKRTLFCNLGAAIEGTTRVIYPTARVLAASYDGTLITLNDQHISASVSAQADGLSDVATAGPTDTIVTADFRVETTKELKVTTVDPGSGDPVYVAPSKKGADGSAGSVVEYVIKIQYAKGSMIADAPDEAGGDYEVDITLLDHYTDDNPNNNSPLSTGAVLYDWDPSMPGCELVGNHGPNASVSCTQVNHALDLLSKTLTAGDGVNDPNIEIALKNIDVRDPDQDSNLVELKLNLWFSKANDIETAGVDGNCDVKCEIFTINSVGVYDTSGATPTVTGYNPVSTEDASGNNLPNNHGNGETHPDYVTYPLVYTTPGSWSVRKSFYGVNGQAATTGKPTLTRAYAAGETIPMLLDIFDYRFLDGAKSQLCDKIDTHNFEYVGLSAPYRIDMGYSWNNYKQHNPAFISYGDSKQVYTDAAPYVSFLYSNEPNPTLVEQRDDTCDDDVNNDGKYVLDGINQTTQQADAPNDWVTDTALLPGGAATVTKVRMETVMDNNYLSSLDPESTRAAFTSNHLLKIKDDAVGYPNPDGHTYLPNFSKSRRHNGDGNWTAWNDSANGYHAVSADPNEAGFSYEFHHADRVILVSSSASIDKYTAPRGIKVVRGGERIDFILEPRVTGKWSPNITTATIKDALSGSPSSNSSSYVKGSERFSVDGGTTWLTYDEYLASNPAVTLTSAPNQGPKTLLWKFDDLQTGEQLPLIRYTVLIDPGVTAGRFVNTATLDSEIAVDLIGGPDPDGDGPLRSSPDGVGDTQRARYQLFAFTGSGLDVQKRVKQPVYPTNTPFEFELIYQNLGGENYSQGDFIDILPYNTDGTAANSSGLASSRRPGTRFNGLFSVSGVTVNNGETVYATDAAPTTLQQDPCHESNQPAGYVPVAGDVCYQMYVNNGNQLAGGATTGSGATNWVECSSLSPLSCGNLTADTITGLRFNVGTVAQGAGGQSILLELTPTGNVGGTPALDDKGAVTEASTGDIYTNNFGGRVPELSLLVISNDVSVTMVSGSIGDYVWHDVNGDGVQDADETPLANVTLSLLDKNGAAIYVDPATGGVVSADTTGAVPYQVTTDAAGLYKFDNLPAGDYTVAVDENTVPDRLRQSFDLDGTLDNRSAESLTLVNNVLGQLVDVEDNTDHDFGYRNASVDLSLSKTLDKTTAKRGEVVTYTLTVRNDGQDNASGVKVEDQLPAGVTYQSHAPATEVYNGGIWDVGTLPAGESKTLAITVVVD